MVLRSQLIAPLETIYEESGSFIASNIDIQNQLNNYEHTNRIINGLISSRSIPSVDIQRKLAYENQQRLPIEVQYRDGSKCYIHPSTTETMIKNRRKLFDSSQNNLSSENLINTNLTKKKFQSKPPLVITLITADDLYQANISPSTSTSPNNSERSGSILSQSTSSLNTLTTMKNKQKVSLEQLTTVTTQTPVQSVTNSTSSNSRSSGGFSFQSPQESVPINHSQNSIPSQLYSTSLNQPSTISTQLPSIANLNSLTSSLQVPMNNDENEKNSSLNCNLSNNISSYNSTNQTLSHTIKQNPPISVGGGTRSAFRPFLKPIRFNQQSQMPLNINGKTYNPPPPPPQQQQQQQQQMISYFQQYSPMSSSNLGHTSLQLSSIQSNQVISNHPYNSIIPTNPSSNINSLNSSNYDHQKASISISNNKNIDNSLILPRISNISNKSAPTFSFAFNPNVKWLNIPSKSIYDISNLSTKYSNIPLHITLPVTGPKFNQKLIMKHDIALENRLLNAGVSPETITFYERILQMGDNRQNLIYH